MKKIVFFAILTALSLSGMAQKRVAVYVDGEDATLTNYVTSEMVRAISQSWNYIAVNRSDDFSKQLQNERSYQQSGMVDDKQIARFGRESGVEYVCVIKITKTTHGEYSIEARLIDVETSDIKASDRRSANYYGNQSGMSYVGFKYVDEAIKKIGSTITNFESKSYRNGFLQYSGKVKSKVVQNNFGEEQELKEYEVKSLLVANSEAYDLYENGMDKLNGNYDTYPLSGVLAGLLTLTFGGYTLYAFVEDAAVPAGKAALCVATAASASWLTYLIVKPKMDRKSGTRKIKKAIGLYNARNSYADNIELSVGFGVNSMGLTLRF